MIYAVTMVDQSKHFVDLPGADSTEPIRSLRSWAVPNIPPHTYWLVSTAGVLLNLNHIISCDPSNARRADTKIL